MKGKVFVALLLVGCWQLLVIQSVVGQQEAQKTKTVTRRTQRVVPLPEIRVVSPSGKVAFQLDTNPERLTFHVTMNDRYVIEPSPLDMRVDHYHLSSGVVLRGMHHYEINESYPWHGVHSTALNHCKGLRLLFTHDLSMLNYELEVRAYNDGVAFRHVVEGQQDMSHVPDEYSTIILPRHSTVWYHDLDGHYEAEYERKDNSDVPPGQWAGPPLTFELPNGNGFGSITEANLVNYSGMALEANGRGGWVIGLGHRHPINYPYELRYGRDEAKRLATPASVVGPITTPWRVVLTAPDLNTLVNSDILPNLCPPADPKLFPQGIKTPWLAPGLCVWDYVDRNYVPRGTTSQFDRMKDFSRMAGLLGAKYHILEGFAYSWSDEMIREFVDDAKQHGVRVLFWRHSRNLRTPESQDEFFARLHRLGVGGAKIDFFDHEAKENIDLYESLLAKAAQYQCVVNFHGANKPTGRLRTWPNAMLYEGVRGMESSGLKERARHETILPFTRYLAGPADYTTMIFTERRRDSSWAHQIACLATFHSPILTIAGHPKSVLDNPAQYVIKSVQPVWDETIVLPPSRIGELSVMARRSGDMWMLAIMNGGPAKTISVPLSFLGDGRFKATLVRDAPDNSGAVILQEINANRTESAEVHLLAGGGFLGRFMLLK